jgi:rhodanese-related sulfurtransferase
VASDREPAGATARAVRRVSPSEAKSLLDLGYFYVDVRSVEEFHELHPTGALNVPLMAGGRKPGSPSTEGFLALMRRLFAEDAKIVVGCATGVRSLYAAELLLASGFTDVVDQRAGMEGARGPFGNLLEPGWSEAGLPVASGPDAGSLAALQRQGEGDAARARS